MESKFILKEPKVALLCITHDPGGVLVTYIEKVNRILLSKNYLERLIVVSDETHPDVLSELQYYGFKVKTVKKEGCANARRSALKFANTSSNCDYFHYCDFDRLITWCLNYSDELNRIINLISETDFLIVGRTQKAFDTHPVEWQETEKITNYIFSQSIKQEVDITAGSCGFSRKAIPYLIKDSQERMTDAEWPLIVSRITKLNINNVAVDGLLYSPSLNKPRTDKDPVQRWIDRVKLTYFITQSILNVKKDNDGS